MADDKKGIFDKMVDAVSSRDEKAAAEAARKAAAEAEAKAAAALKAKAEAEAKAATDAKAKVAAEAKSAADAKAKTAAETKAAGDAAARAAAAAKASMADKTAAAQQKLHEAEAKLADFETKAKADAAAKAAAAAEAERQRVAAEEARRNAVKHTVAAGETLSHISLKHYKTANRWKEIYEANEDVIGPNANLIKAGQVLVIPNADGK